MDLEMRMILAGMVMVSSAGLIAGGLALPGEFLGLAALVTAAYWFLREGVKWAR